MVDTDRMVDGMGQVANYANLLVRSGSGREDHSLEIVGRDGLGAAEGEEQTAGGDAFHGSLVDVAIAFKPLLQ